MNTQSVKRKLTAIFSADVKGYSRLMGEDEAATVQALKNHREMMTSLIEQHRGRVIDSPGDNLLAEFASVVDAVQCAVEIQEVLKARNANLPDNRKMLFRIGINLGDVIEDDDRIYGDGVNIAARIEALAEPGGICISRSVYDQIKKKLILDYEYMGEHTVKNIAEPLMVYKVPMEPEATVGVRDEKGFGVKRWQWATLAVVVVFIIVAGALAFWYFWLHPSPSPEEVASVKRMAFPLPDKPSIAVLPFVNMSDDPEQEYFSDGLTEDIITDLSSLSGIFVISRTSSFFYKGKAVKIKEVSEELGVRYVLEGTVRKSGSRVRITAQLIDATTGGHLWAKRYDRELEEVFSVQDEVTNRIVKALAVKLGEREKKAITLRKTDSLEAYDLTLRGWALFRRFSKETNTRAREMFETAIAHDPEYVDAYAGFIWTKLTEWYQAWTGNPAVLDEALQMAQEIVNMDESLPDTHVLLGNVYLWKGKHDKAMAEFERAVTLNPNHAEALYATGNAMIYSGEPQGALSFLNKAMRLNPNYPDYYSFSLGQAYFHLGRYKEAIVALKKALIKNKDFSPASLYLAASYGLTEKLALAQAEVEELRKRSSSFLAGKKPQVPFKNPTYFDQISKGLSKAGLL
jgi:adenylate cyclase